MFRFTKSSALVCLLACLACIALINRLPAARNKPAAKKKSSGKSIDFVRDIRPILTAHCVKCHGPKRQESGLRLDHRRFAMQGGDSGPAIVVGKSVKSELVRRIKSTDDDERMPPAEGGGKKLSAAQIARIVGWIDQGAVWPKGADGPLRVHSTHWSYQPIVRHSPPKMTRRRQVHNPIDNFVLAKLDKRHISPSPPAGRYTLIKRLYYDLLGLPPTPAEVDSFVNDTSPTAYERLVDQLLKSPHFGERWGRHWLDMARYADSDGYEKDRPRPNAWRYRDWVIKAINSDMPYNQFTVEQLAGDLLPTATPMQILATAFNRQTLTNTEGGTDKEEFRVEAVVDRINTLGTVWLGLTVGCARCHSHKYDKLTQAEFYQLFAFFNNGDETTARINISNAAVTKYQKDKAAHQRQLNELSKQLAAGRRQVAATLPKREQALKRLLASPSTEVFRRLNISRVTVGGGAVVKNLRDGSVQITGKNPASNTYTVHASTTLQNITGFRIDAMAEKTGTNKGPGRTTHGNFVLTEFRLFAASTKKLTAKNRVVLSGASADFSQKGFFPAAVLDGNEKTGWAIAPQFARDHQIVLRTAVPLSKGKTTWLKLELSQQYGGQHTIGRFRILARTGTDPAQEVPKSVQSALAVASPKRTAKQTKVLVDFLAARDTQQARLLARLASLKKKTPKPPLMTVRVVSQRTKNPRVTHVLGRGDFLQPMGVVKPNTPAVLRPFTPRRKDGLPDRLDLARWLVDPSNPLTPRVTVNHIWANLFGVGLVSTPDDFGVRGEKPSHPKLLDWLASEFLRLKWSRKAIIKRIVMSATYRRSSRFRPELTQIDPQNRLLYRQNRVRVEAEVVRDLYLAAGGLLSKKIGGPSVFPPMPADVAALSYAGNFRWKTSKGEDRYRRGMYTFFKRTAPYPNLTAFDCPDSNKTSVRRNTSNTPLQALTTLNNVVYLETAQAMARRVLSQKLSQDTDRLTYAFRLCMARSPAKTELAQFSKLLQAGRTWYRDHQKDAKSLVGPMPAAGVAIDENAAWIATARIIMNMDEFITRE